MLWRNTKVSASLSEEISHTILYHSIGIFNCGNRNQFKNLDSIKLLYIPFLRPYYFSLHVNLGSYMQVFTVTDYRRLVVSLLLQVCVN